MRENQPLRTTIECEPRLSLWPHSPSHPESESILAIHISRGLRLRKIQGAASGGFVFETLQTFTKMQVL